MRSGSINIAGIDLEIAEEGTGAPVLMLHGAGGFDARQPVNALFSEAPAADLSLASRVWKIRTALIGSTASTISLTSIWSCSTSSSFRLSI